MKYDTFNKTHADCKDRICNRIAVALRSWRRHDSRTRLFRVAYRNAVRHHTYRFRRFQAGRIFFKDLYRLAFQYDLAFGILTLALGIIILLNPDNIMNFICVVLGVAVLADGLLKIQIALDSKRFGISKWWLILAVAFIACVCGILLLVRPSESIRVIIVLMGISLLAEGILNLSTVITAVKIVRNQQPDYIEIHEYTEKED